MYHSQPDGTSGRPGLRRDLDWPHPNGVPHRAWWDGVVHLNEHATSAVKTPKTGPARLTRRAVLMAALSAASSSATTGVDIMAPVTPC